ncbi:MAG: helicase-related protein [bacterium]|nr:helicase-related protein [bacterium]
MSSSPDAATHHGPSTFKDIGAGDRLAGVVPNSSVTVVALQVHGPDSATLTYRTAEGGLGERLLSSADLATLTSAPTSRWTFDADGELFRLVSEARRMRFAHLADPFAAVDTSSIEPYPHQIDAVYNRLLPQRPVRFVLADDPGAGKTIMSGLLIRELMLRGDVERCLIVAPGSLVEQWQDELADRFGLRFEVMSRATVEASYTGNPFAEKNLLIARLDQLARAEDLQARLRAVEWDLVIVDEAHKMAAHSYGAELKRTKRFALGELLRDRARHFLLLTATPHNGKNEDFLAFLSLVHPDRFAGQLRSRPMPDVSDVMRRLVKENLRTFDGKRLFPQRFAHSAKFELSEPETKLYEAVTNYVRTGMAKAADMAGSDAADRRRGIIIGFALAGLQRRLASSPAAIHHSLRRRCERLDAQAKELRRLAASGEPVPVVSLPAGVRLSDLEDFDSDEYDDAEFEELENVFIDSATASATAEDLEAEVQELRGLVALAEEVRSSGTDTKWTELRELLRQGDFGRAAAANCSDGGGDASGPTDAAAVPAGPRKLIVFSEHKDTLDYVADRIRAELGRPEAVITIHGGVKRHDRRELQERFRVDPAVRVLVATDAAGEGVNLQVANMMVNYDLPWNPNRIEQRFGRIHRIGQQQPCHLWNLVAHETREGNVFTRLFEKIEQQKGAYGDQVYDVLGDSHINTSLQQLLLDAIRTDVDPAHLAYMDEVIEGEIGEQLTAVLEERALVASLADPAANEKIRDLMELSKARKLQPWFVEAFFSEALKSYGGRIVGRERGRFEITRVPAAVRAHADTAKGPVHDRYARVTFDKDHVRLHGADRAELISPGSPLLTAVVTKILADHGHTLDRGATLIDPDDLSTEPRLLVYLDHAVTDGRHVSGHRQVVSRRFQYVKIDRHGAVSDPGGEPYIGYQPPTEEQRALLDANLNLDWVDHTAESTARDWAIEHLAGPHFEEIAAITKARVERVREAVRERLESEIRHWDERTEQIKAQELSGGRPKISSGRARARADDLETRLARRRLELDMEADLHSSPPNIVAAALIIPQGLLDQLAGTPPDPQETADKMETDRRAVAAVLAAEHALGRTPEAQAHSNPGFDVLSVDPTTGTHYFIEVKGHLPRTTEISVSAQQVQKARSNPDRWRLAVVSVPDDPHTEPTVHYLVDPFGDYTLHFAESRITLNVADLLAAAGPAR